MTGSPRPSRQPPAVAFILLTVSLLIAGGSAACTSSGPTPSTTGDGSIRVASFDFAESEVLAELYAQALEARGYGVARYLGLGPRELVEPALAKGLVDLLPEYSGSALQFATLGATLPSADPVAANQALSSALAGRGLRVLASAQAQDANVIVVTARTAARYGLTKVSDLGPVAGQLVFGGPPECPDRPFCLEGLAERYGLAFESFVPLDAGGPLTLAALAAQEIDVGLMFSSDPNIPGRNLVPLIDDRSLQPAENVTPVVRKALVERYGPGMVDALNAVSSRLTTDQLVAMNAAVTVDGRPATAVAAGWLRDHGLG